MTYGIEKSPEFPFKECLVKHDLDFCISEKECKWIRTDDCCQTYYCELVMWKLEEEHPMVKDVGN